MGAGELVLSPDDTTMTLPPSWRDALGAELHKSYFRELTAFVNRERARTTVHPRSEDVFAALELTAYADVDVLLLGQDPYHDDGQAHGLCFSVKPPTTPPPSLRNIFKELQSDLGVSIPAHGDLSAWAKQGILLLNAVLTVRAHEANSHKDKGWETFTDAIIAKVNEKTTPVVFCFWGNYAKKKARLVDAPRHTVLLGAHPSPLSAKKFFGSKPFSTINAALARAGKKTVDWRLGPEK